MAELSIWAPHADAVEVEMDGHRESMKTTGDGWWRWESVNLRHGTEYALWVDDEGPFPDPRSASQPHGVHGASCWVNPARFEWTDQDWQPPSSRDAIIYELHIGTFTPEGTFSAAIERLDHLAQLGITHIELMPVAEFAGARGWGYDGVNLYAPHHAYRGPQGLQRLVDACHRRGMAVIMDVVYNHLGPVGNYLSRFGPYFTDRYHTPWGQAVNLDGPESDEVRRYLIDNALMWLRDYHCDGLRIDAIHAFLDQSATHFLEQMRQEVTALEKEVGRHCLIIAESDLNDPRYIRPAEEGGMGLDSQWNEDFHHALHALLTSEQFGYYQDFGTVADLAKAMKAGFAYTGRYSSFRKRHHGRSAEGLSGDHFVACIQNHDQIGNRGAGERIGHLVGTDEVKLGAAVTLLSPFVPMLFQGEEWSASSPFLYFVDFEDPELIEAVRKGRQSEFEGFGWNPENIPDPQSEETFLRSKLEWQEKEGALHRELLEWYRALITLRKSQPDFAPGPLDAEGVAFHEEDCWLRFRRGSFQVACNFSGEQRRVPLDVTRGERLILTSASDVKLDKGKVILPPHGLAVIGPKSSG